MKYDFDEVFARYSVEVSVLHEVTHCLLDGYIFSVLNGLEKGKKIEAYNDDQDFLDMILNGLVECGYATAGNFLTTMGKKALVLFREYDEVWLKEYGHTRFVSDDDTI